MAKILFDRSGGLLGQAIDLKLDLDTVPAHESQYLLHLIQESDFFHLPENFVAPSTPDEFLYTITVEAGAMRHRVRVSDTSMPKSLQPLIHELSTLAAVS